MRLQFLILLNVIFCFRLLAQTNELTNQKNEPNFLKFNKGPVCRHTISFYKGYAFVPDAIVDDEDKDSEVISTVGLFYQYKFTKKIGLGFISELELAKYTIDDEGTPLFRENILLLALPFYWEPIHGLEFFVGPGIELERNKNFTVLALGVEYNLYISNGWFISPEFSVEIKNIYTTFTLGIKFNKAFGRVFD